MYDREDEQVIVPAQANIQSTAHTTELAQELKNTAFLMSGLYQQLQAERSVITSATGQMTHAAKQFEESIKQLDEMERQLKATLSQHMQKATEHSIQQVAATVGEHVAKAASTEGKKVVEKLRQSAHQSTQLLNQYQQTITQSAYKRWAIFIAISLLSGLSGALGIHYFLPEQAFTQDQWHQMEAGQTIMAAWDKLSQAERDRIISLSKGEEPSPTIETVSKTSNKKKNL